MDDDLENERSDSDESDDGNKLNSVKAYQSKQEENTCLVHDNPDENIIENLTTRPLSKKKSIKSTKSFEIAPGVLYEHCTYMFQLHNLILLLYA